MCVPQKQRYSIQLRPDRSPLAALGNDAVIKGLAGIPELHERINLVQRMYRTLECNNAMSFGWITESDHGCRLQWMRNDRGDHKK